MTPWHTLPVGTVFERLGSGPGGLSGPDAAGRIEAHGANELQKSRAASPWQVLLEQFRNVLVLILLAATIVSAFLGHAVEAVAIVVIVLFAVLLGFVQEYRAERAVEALRTMAAPAAAVVRDGVELQVPARSLVPGDVIVLRAGDRVPADVRLFEAVNLQVDEAPLTGESAAVDKRTAPLDDPDLTVGDRANMAYAGTAVTYGRGKGVVVATGMGTEFGSIAGMLETVETGRTPLQQNLDRVGRILAWAALVVVGLIVGLGLLRGQPFIEMFVFGVALAVAVVPEALPAVVTISLALGVKRMVRRNALVRRLPAVETLGSTSVICSDKTGTLTRDEMTVRKVLVAGQTIEISGVGYEPKGTFASGGLTAGPAETLRLLLRAAALVSDARVVYDGAAGRWRVHGDPTEGALITAAAKAGLDKAELDRRHPRIDEIPFTPETKRMTTLHRAEDGVVAYSKGAPEVILESCTRRWDGIEERDLGERERAELVEAARRMAGGALRVLAVAYKRDAVRATAERDMTWLGLVGMMDPPRPEAGAAVRSCAEAGIKVVMITGDHPLTARSVAAELGLRDAGRVVTGTDVDAMDDDELSRAVETTGVFARVTPANKLRLVTALQAKGYVAAMTGDGVNDAPALKKADIGVAMGVTGTDVSREAAAMTLTDDNFASIVAAVEEGRVIFENIKKYLMYLLSSNIGEIGLMAGASLAGWPLPLSAVQILYVNLATDGLPALALAFDPPDADVMKRRPRAPRAGIFSRPVTVLMAVGALWSTAVNLGVFTWALRSGRGIEQAMTLTFVSLVLIQFFKAYNFRSDRHSLLRRPWANKWLNLAVAWELVLLMAVVYLPILHEAFGSYALPVTDWLIAAGAAATVSPVLELAKWGVRHRWFGSLE